ncbi:hypothetical protein DINM_005133 [Dirofilaria immitis]|nr:hypothetical protein [Dirofilaria immitis]
MNEISILEYLKHCLLMFPTYTLHVKKDLAPPIVPPDSSRPRKYHRPRRVVFYSIAFSNSLLLLDVTVNVTFDKDFSKKGNVDVSSKRKKAKSFMKMPPTSRWAI